MMGPAHYVVMALRAIGILMVNPSLGGGSQLRSDKLRALTDMLANLIEGAEDTLDELREFAAEVEALALSNQSPTREQWSALIARDAAARDRIAENRRLVAERVAERGRLVTAEEEARLRAEEEARLNAGGDPPDSADQ